MNNQLNARISFDLDGAFWPGEEGFEKLSFRVLNLFWGSFQKDGDYVNFLAFPSNFLEEKSWNLQRDTLKIFLIS